MTRVYAAPKPLGAPGQTHALVIGVNDYPHLLNGTAFANMPAAAAMGLGQLTSPVQSAWEFQRWLRNRYTNPAAPLGTVELLLSSQAGITPATLANVKPAFDAWEAECNQSADNVAVLYFCGHGVEAEVLALLLEDFGRAPNRLWENAIDFDGTFLGMAECKARTQCYFLDCCREKPIEALRQLGRLSATPLKTPISGRTPPREAPVYLGSPEGMQAHAPANAVSYFTRALLDCLESFGARGHDGTNWVVSTDSLKTALKVRMRRIRVKGKRLACDTARGAGNLGAVDLHGWPGKVKVLTDVACVPPDALEHTTLDLTNATGPVDNRAPHADPWELELDGDNTIRYTLTTALVPGSPYTAVTGFAGCLVYPPHQTFTLRATP